MSEYSRLSVVGSMNGETVVYPTPEQRKPRAGEVVEFGGRFWRVINPDGCGNEDVTRQFTHAWKQVEDYRFDDLQATYEAFIASTRGM